MQHEISAYMTNVALERVLSAGDAENLNIAQLNKQKWRV